MKSFILWELCLNVNYGQLLKLKQYALKTMNMNFHVVTRVLLFLLQFPTFR